MFNFSEELKPELKSERKLKNEPPTKPVIGQVLNKSCTGNETSTEQAVVPSINDRNNTNFTNNQNVANLNEQAKKFKEINNSSNKIVIPSEVEGTQKEKSSAKKEMFSTFADTDKNQIEKSRQKDVDDFVIPSDPETSGKVSPLKKATPSIEEIKTYFLENNFPELEAQKFFNYFTSVGWLVGGKTPMINWQAAAQNWIINSVNFNNNTEITQTNRPKHLNTSTDKNYAEPL
jgi:hypothetical protein